MIDSEALSRPARYWLALAVLLLAARPARSAPPPDSTFALPPLTSAQPGIALPRLGGYIQVRAVGQKSVGMTTTLNRARFSIDGALPRRFAYRVLVEMQAATGARTPATPSLREATVRWNPAPFAITAGEFKTPFTREYLIPVPALELADLAVVVDSLAPKYREVLVLRDVQHLSIEETAQALGLTIGNVKTRLLRARMQMRDALAPGIDGSWASGKTEWERVRPW